jgi:hypothetical protein
MSLHSQSIIGTRISEASRHAIAAKAAADRQDKQWPTAAPRTSSAERFVTNTLFAWPHDVTPEREEAFAAAIQRHEFKDGHRSRLPASTTDNSADATVRTLNKVLESLSMRGEAIVHELAADVGAGVNHINVMLRELRRRGKAKGVGFREGVTVWALDKAGSCSTSGRKSFVYDTVLTYLKAHGSSTIPQIVDATGVSSAAAAKLMRLGMDRGELTRERGSKNAAWVWSMVDASDTTGEQQQNEASQ